MKREEIINTASIQAGDSPLPIEEQAALYPEYELRLRSILQTQPWYFSFRIFNIDPTNKVEGESLGFEHAYLVEDNILEVLDVRAESPDFPFSTPVSAETAIRYGVRIPQGFFPENQGCGTAFTFVDGILYVDQELTEKTEILVKIQVDIDSTPDIFQRYMVALMADFIVVSINQENERSTSNRVTYRSLERLGTQAIIFNRRQLQRCMSSANNRIFSWYKKISQYGYGLGIN